MHAVIYALILIFALSGCATVFRNDLAQVAPMSASLRLERLASESNERNLDLFPFAETNNVGAGPRQDRVEMTFTAEHRERQRAHRRWVLSQLKEIAFIELSNSEKLTHQLLDYQSREALEWLEYPFHQQQIFIQLNGGVAFDLIRLVSRQPFRNEADFRIWMTRLQRYPAYLEGVADLMRDGISKGITIPRVLLERSLPQLESLAPDEQDISKSSLWKPISQFPASMDEAARNRIEADYRRVLTTEVFPAIRKLARFVRDDYMPRARTTDGIGGLPQGNLMYRWLVKASTTTDMTPEEIHELGLREVTRIQAKLLLAAEKVGFSGPMKNLRPWIASKPEYYPFTSGEQVLQHLNRIHAMIVPQLPRLFGRFPKARFEIRLTDPAIAASAPPQWYPPSNDGSRPGIFAIPVVNAKEQSVIGLASLLAHEGMPGHHFDGGIKRENKVPEFRRRLSFIAFGEGWGLYAEYLGHDLGLYDSPIDLMGRYLDELYRAGRLVMDTGIHSRGWSREKAIQYMVEECGFSQGSATTEVLRYMAWPAQALGYKIGELTILDIRSKAEQRLGKRFDIRAFHDAILEEGHLPLSMLRQRMEQWSAGQEKL